MRKREPEFRATYGTPNDCLCDGCYQRTRVTKIRLPRISYGNGLELEQGYIHLWYCRECRTKLIEALRDPGMEGEEGDDE